MEKSISNIAKARHRYQRESRLAFAVIRELKLHGLSARYVGKRLNENRVRLQPVDVVIADRVLVLVRVAGLLTRADERFMQANPAAMVFAGSADVIWALPALRGMVATVDPHPLAQILN